MKTLVVTGGTKGLGREISLAFARTGYYVVALYSSDDTAAEELKNALDRLKPVGCVLRQDVCSVEPDVWDRKEIQDAESLVLLHNACAAFAPVPMHQLGWEDFEKNFRVAVKGAWDCTLPLLRLMVKKGGGTVVNVLTSAVSGMPPKGFAAYVTAKHALHGFTLALAVEYSARKIRVFSVSPGYMDTPLTEKWDARLRDTIRAASDRISVPADAAARILALVEDKDFSGGGEDRPV